MWCSKRRTNLGVGQSTRMIAAARGCRWQWTPSLIRRGSTCRVGQLDVKIARRLPACLLAFFFVFLEWNPIPTAPFSGPLHRRLLPLALSRCCRPCMPLYVKHRKLGVPTIIITIDIAHLIWDQSRRVYRDKVRKPHSRPAVAGCSWPSDVMCHPKITLSHHNQG